MDGRRLGGDFYTIYPTLGQTFSLFFVPSSSHTHGAAAAGAEAAGRRVGWQQLPAGGRERDPVPELTSHQSIQVALNSGVKC